jgi:hypothetical protein
MSLKKFSHGRDLTSVLATVNKEPLPLYYQFGTGSLPKCCFSSPKIRVQNPEVLSEMRATTFV